MLLKNKTAVITGCNRGIGKEILKVFSLNGANIFACSRKINSDFENLVNNLTKKYNNKIYPIQLDLDKQEDIKEASKKTVPKIKR